MSHWSDPYWIELEPGKWRQYTISATYDPELDERLWPREFRDRLPTEDEDDC